MSTTAPNLPIVSQPDYQQPTYNGTPVVYNPPPVEQPGTNLIAWAEALSSAHRIATALCETSFVPRHFQGKPIEAAAALMLGDELGFAPVSALRSIFVIGGTPGLYAKAMVALVQSHGHEVWTETDTPSKVAVCGKRRGSGHVEKAEWTPDRARRAGYTNNKKYETDPQAMLYARAASDVCRKVAADVLAGVPYAVEELELADEPATTKRVSRTKPEPPPTPEPDLETPTTEDAPVVDEGPPNDNPPDTITAAQLKKIGASMRDLGMTDRSAALAYVSDVVGRDVTSRNDLSKQEASVLIDELERDAQPPAADPWAETGDAP